MERRTRDDLLNIVDADNMVDDNIEDKSVNIKDECLGCLNSDKCAIGMGIVLIALMIGNLMSGGEIG